MRLLIFIIWFWLCCCGRNMASASQLFYWCLMWIQYAEHFYGPKYCLLKYSPVYMNCHQTHEYGSVLNIESSNIGLTNYTNFWYWDNFKEVSDRIDLPTMFHFQFITYPFMSFLCRLVPGGTWQTQFLGNGVSSTIVTFLDESMKDAARW